MDGVCVIMTAYNAAGSVGRAIKSVLGQTYPCTTLLVVDDRSTDGTYDVIMESVKDASNARVVRPHENLGCGGARAFGLQFVDSTYVAFCDSDDWLESDHIAKMVAYAEAQEADVVHCPLYFIDNETREHSTARNGIDVKEGGELLTELENHWLTSFNCMLVRTSHIQQIAYSTLRCLDDRLSGLRLLLLGGRHVLLPVGCGVRYNYVTNEGSVFHSSAKNIPVYEAVVWMTLAREFYGGRDGVSDGVLSVFALRVLPRFLNNYERNKEAWDKLIAEEFPHIWADIAKFSSSFCVNLLKDKHKLTKELT